MLWYRHVTFHLKVMTIAARAFGVMCVFAGTLAIWESWADPQHRWWGLAIGLLAAPIGIAFLRVKPLKPSDLPASSGLSSDD
jgi:divalent metal cation (Fe/Co/Zn/Cd) transporter